MAYVVNGAVAVANVSDTLGFRMPIDAINTPYQMPAYEIPFNCSLRIKASGLNVGTVYIGPTEASVRNPMTSYSLSRAETIGYQISNSDILWVLGDTLNDFIVCTVEHRRLYDG